MNEQIEQLLELPKDFIYYGDYPVGKTWGIGPLTDYRDADTITRANGIALKKSLESHPEWDEQWTIESFNHWAVGWVENIIYQVINDEGNLTKVAQFLLDWQRKLEDYPVADEDLLAQLEYEELRDTIHLQIGCTDEEIDRIIDWIFENDPVLLYGQAIRHEIIERAAKALGLVEEDEYDAI